MTTYTELELRTHRDNIINRHYEIGVEGPGNEAVLTVYAHGDYEVIIHAYPHVFNDGGRKRLNDEQIDTFMQSTKFDKPLFRTLIVSLDLDVDAALVASLS